MAPFTFGRGRTFGRMTKLVAGRTSNLIIRPTAASVKRAATNIHSFYSCV